MRPAKFRLRPQDKKIGFRREEIIRAVVQMYSQVYEVEEATMPEKDVWENGSPGSLNRPITRGKVRFRGQLRGSTMILNLFHPKTSVWCPYA